MLLMTVLATDNNYGPLSHKSIQQQHFIMTVSNHPCMYVCMYVCLETVIMYKHFTMLSCSHCYICCIISFNGQLILRQRATEISPGRYPMDLACCFILAMKNGTQRRGCLREHFIIQVLGKM